MIYSPDWYKDFVHTMDAALLLKQAEAEKKLSQAVKKTQVHAVIPEHPNALAEIHNHGLEKVGHPNFRVYAPMMFANNAMRLLNILAYAVLTGGEVFKAGERCNYHEWGVFALAEDHNEQGETLLQIVPVKPRCSCCEEGGEQCGS